MTATTLTASADLPREGLADLATRVRRARAAGARRRAMRAARAERTRSLERAYGAMQTYRDTASLGAFARFA